MKKFFSQKVFDREIFDNNPQNLHGITNYHL